MLEGFIGVVAGAAAVRALYETEKGRRLADRMNRVWKKLRRLKDDHGR